MKTTRLLLASLVLLVPAAHAATLFSHTFDGGTGALNATSVDSGTLAPQNWVAFDGVNANGVFNTATGTAGQTGGSATLAFSPANGFEYSLDARILNITGTGDWIGLGFANGQNSSTGQNFRFIDQNVVGTAWMLVRGSNTPNANTTFLGSGVTGSATDFGVLNPEPFPSLNNNGGSIDLRILLNTTGGSGNWTASWLGKLTTDIDYTTLRAATPVPLADQARYTSVGFASSNNVTDGQLESFSLTIIPEPSAALLGGLGLLTLLRRRR